MMDKKLRACVIGMGPIGNIHSECYSKLPNVELVGVCDIIPERAINGGKRFNVPYYLNCDTMLRSLNQTLPAYVREAMSIAPTI